ncbi:hypothetical protein [Clostridium paraputrificum]|uniref:hypothetical protein n=1 Tax=Clostridium paraputrificum TaxID=29363 RepID=UPI00189AA7B1|nr:hypothetical protein [Clostridium paraputrificum]MDB2124858.1 hypothetical protein [Clostridium paraputrificum]
MRNNRKTSEAQRNADKRWREKNREHANYLKNRTSARCFIRNKATLEDIEELLRLRAEMLSKENNLLC